MRRILGITFGLVTQAAFLATVPVLFLFLRNDFSAAPTGSLWYDAATAMQFSIIHSFLLWPPVRKKLGGWVHREFYGCFYCLVTCASLWLLFASWHGSSWVLFQWPEWLRPAVQAGFYASWAALFYSLSLTGLGYQTGLTPWWHWARRRNQPAREFRPRGAYRWLRHPVYVSFLGLVWLTPVVTADRAVLMAVWTAYIVIGSHLKDERMIAYIGQAYREYAVQVPGFPLIGFGPLGARRATPMRPASDLPASQDHAKGRAAA